MYFKETIKIMFFSSLFWTFFNGIGALILFICLYIVYTSCLGLYIANFDALMLRKVIRIALVLISLLLLWQHQLIIYGVSQLRGQLNVILNSREVPDVLADPGVPDSIKYKLNLIQEIKQFTVDSLGFESSDNYTSYFDQKGKPSLWVVTAAKPYALEPKEWYFPMLGRVPYKGFFIYSKAEDEERKLEQDGWDTNLRVAGGWSTLGWFSDPVLSNMLSQGPGELANTIIHELTHGNLFVKDSVAFNENLASFFGDQGARKFLGYKYGKNSPESLQYERSQSDRQNFSNHILRGADRLNEMYTSSEETLADNLRYSSKRELIDKIKSSVDTLTLNKKQRYLSYLKKSKVNNAFFMSYLRYRADFTVFEKELELTFKGNLKGYFDHFRQLYPSL